MKQLILFLTLFYSFLCFSQKIAVENYSVEDGLPSPEVYDIIQDKYGYLWFATDHGLSRYNGYEFENFGLKDGITNSTVFRFFKQKNGDIWCNTFNHTLFSISGKKPVFTPFLYNHILTDALTDKWVEHEVYVDKNKSIYISYSNHMGYIRVDSLGDMTYNEWNSNRNHYFNIKMKIEDGEKKFSYVTQYQSLTKGQVISPNILSPTLYTRSCYLTVHQASLYTYANGAVISVPDRNDVVLKFESKPISAGKFDEHHFWIGFRFGGIKIFTYEGVQVDHLLRKKYITDLYKDHEGSIWLSTLSSGVFKLKNIGVKVIESNVGEEWIASLTVDDNGTIYTGNYTGDVSMVSGDSLISIYKPQKKYPAFVSFYKESLLFNSQHGFFRFNGKKVHSIHKYECAKWIPHGSDSIVISWYGSIHFLKNNVLIGQIFNDLRVGAMHSFMGKIFLGTKHGLYVIEKEELLPYKHQKEFLTHRIDVLASQKNTLLLGTRGHGLGILTGDDLVVINQSDGLTSDYISAIYVEDDQNIWLCTNTGLNRVLLLKEGYKIQSFTFDDGLPSNQVLDIEIVDDTVWVATRKGLCFFNKSLLEEKESEHTNYFLRFLDVKINDESKNHDKGCDLNYDENRIEFNFQGISFKTNALIVYRYKMLGLENEWTHSKERRAIYPSLQPGQYQFIVGVGEEEISLNIIIHPPYWKTWPFILAVITMIILFIYLFFRYNILSYNRNIIRELLRQLLKRVKPKVNYLVIKEQGQDIKIDSSTIFYVKSSGNYLEIFTKKGTYLIRMKIGDFLAAVPDPIEYLRVRRSYIVRIDKIEQKTKKEIIIQGQKIAIGETYLKELDKIHF